MMKYVKVMRFLLSQIMIFESQLLLTDILLPRDIKCMNAFFKGGLDAQKYYEGLFLDTQCSLVCPKLVVLR